MFTNSVQTDIIIEDSFSLVIQGIRSGYGTGCSMKQTFTHVEKINDNRQYCACTESDSLNSTL